MNDAYAGESMREFLDRLKSNLGDKWPKALADEMLSGEREVLAEALKKYEATEGGNGGIPSPF